MTPEKESCIDGYKNKISKIVAKWGFQNHDKDQKVNEVRFWLSNFELTEIPFMVNLLSFVHFVDEAKQNRLLDTVSDAIKQKFANNLSKTRILSLEEDGASSGSQFLYSLKKKLEVADIFNYASKKELENAENLVFIDDIIGSGKQAAKLLRKWLSINKNCHCYSLIGLEKGIEHIKTQTGVEPFSAELLKEESKVFSKGSTLSDKDACKAIAKKYGDLLYGKQDKDKRHPLGYDDSQLLICFRDDCPNNTLPIIWAGPKSELPQLPNTAWHPLFKRRYVKKTKNYFRAHPSIQQNGIKHNKSISWEKYRNWLNDQTLEEVFNENFSLAQIYIPLCAYYRIGNENEEKKYVVDLKDSICKWLDQNDNNDSIRIIRGGPGSGKSSFVKMFAAEIADKHNVLFFQLHRLNLGNDLEKSIEKFLVANGFFEKSPIGSENPLLIIFDGLDELTQQGNAGIEAARAFVDNVDDQLLKNFNAQKLQHRIVLTGRDLPIQDIESKFGKEQIFHVLPYFLKPITFEEVVDYGKYIDEAFLLKDDKRDLWWRKYGALTGKEYEGLPESLNSDALVEITSQPLLNYLLAINYDPSQRDTSWDDINRNKLYDILFDNVYRRVWETKGHSVAGKIKKDDFEAILEEIAISVWQSGESRTTTVSAIKERCQKNQLDNLLTSFQEKAEENAESSILKLLVAFYFRQFNTNDIDKAFEFTHKSFCEYLVARRIVRQLRNTSAMIEQHKTRNDGWTEESTLVNWIDLCGKMRLNADIYTFLCDEMKQHKNSEVEKWQKMLCALISHMLKFGMPFELIDPRQKFVVETQMSRNAEESLLATLSACSQLTNIVSNIEWKNEKSTGEWLSKLHGQSDSESLIFSYSCLVSLPAMTYSEGAIFFR